MAQNRRLTVIESREGRTAVNMVGGQAFVGTDRDGDTFRCGSCDERLASKMAPHELMNVVLICPACGALSDVPDGPAEIEEAIHLTSGTFNFSDVVKMQPGKPIRGTTLP